MTMAGRPGRTVTTDPDRKTDVFIVRVFPGRGEAEVRLDGKAYIVQQTHLTVVDRSGCRVSLSSHLAGHDCPRR